MSVNLKNWREVQIYLWRWLEIEDYKPDDNKGISVVLLHAGKGHKFFNSIKDKIKLRKCD